MICPACQHTNAVGTRFCAQCGAALPAAVASDPGVLTPASTPTAIPIAAVPVASPSGCNRTVLVVLGVLVALLLLFAIGLYVTFHVVANKVRGLTGADSQTTEQTQSGSSNQPTPDPGARETGNVIGKVLGTDAKGKNDISQAIGNMTRAGAQIEQHDRATGNNGGVPDASDTQQALDAAGGLMGAIVGSLGGKHRVNPVDFRTLEAQLPTTLPGLERGQPQGAAKQGMGVKGTSTSVDYRGTGNARIGISIADISGVSGLLGIAKVLPATTDSENADGYEKDVTINGRSIHEKYQTSARHGELSVIVADRFEVDVDGDNVDMEALHDALGQVDLGKLESMKNLNPQR